MSSSHSQPVLALDDVQVRFGGVTALRGVTFDVSAGEVCGLMGPNGAGKTTLFDVVSGLCEPQVGSIRLDGIDITTWSATRVARAGVRRTFQQVQTFGWLSVADNVLAALEWHGGGGGIVGDLLSSPFRRRQERARRQRVDEALELCGLAPHAEAAAGSLPIGVARLVELARAVVDRPRVLLLDEPTSGLDAEQAERLAACVRSVRDETGAAVLLVEHDVEFLLALSDRVVVLDLGVVIASGPPEVVRAHHAVRSAYLGAQP